MQKTPCFSGFFLSACFRRPLLYPVELQALGWLAQLKYREAHSGCQRTLKAGGCFDVLCFFSPGPPINYAAGRNSLARCAGSDFPTRTGPRGEPSVESIQRWVDELQVVGNSTVSLLPAQNIRRMLP
jgi:hypothetical protein